MHRELQPQPPSPASSQATPEPVTETQLQPGANDEEPLVCIPFDNGPEEDPFGHVLAGLDGDAPAAPAAPAAGSGHEAEEPTRSVESVQVGHGRFMGCG